MTFEKKLAHLRKREGLSQAEVSEKLDVSRQAVSRWESGDAKPSTENLQALCKLYHVPLDYLFNEGEDELPAPAPVAPATESGSEWEAREKRKQRIKWLVIGVVVLVLLVCCSVWYQSGQIKNDMDLHTIQNEDTNSFDVPEFDLNWG